MFPQQGETPTSRAANGGTSRAEDETSVPDYITPTSHVPTAEQWSRLDAYNETVLLRGHLYLTYSGVIRAVEDQDPRAIFSPARHVALQAIVTVARRAVEDGNGDSPVDPAVVLGELERIGGPEALQARTVALPAAAAGPAEGMHATTPNLSEIPELWQVAHSARLRRAFDTLGRSMIRTAQEWDEPRAVKGLRQLQHLFRLAQAAGISVERERGEGHE